MLAELLTIFSSSGVGAIVGGVFGFLNRREDRKALDRSQRYKIDMIYAQSEAKSGVADAMAFAESQKTISKFGDAVKSAVRPIITGALLYMTWSILQRLELLTGGIGTLPPAEAVELYRTITLNIISLTATCVSWWFASRPTGLQKIK